MTKILGRTLAVVVALTGVLTIAALVSAPAFGLTFELALWLVAGADVTEPVAVQGTGEFLYKNVLNGAEFRCSVVGVGTVEPEGLGTNTEELTLSGTKIAELGSAGVPCTAVKVCETGPEAFPKGLPFLTELVQDPEDGKFYALVFGALEFKCKIFGITLEETCEPPNGAGLSFEVTNVGNEVEAVGTSTPKGNCTGGTEESEATAVTGNLLSTDSGATIAASLP